MTVNGYTSRAMPSPETYAAMLERRIEAKKSGNKTVANALKLVANTTYGSMKAYGNKLYDPKMARSICISGQLYLCELMCHLHAVIPGLTVTECNTDGLMVEYDDQYDDQVHEITDEWQARTGFELEEDKIRIIIHKDVSNYIEVAYDGSVKIKGSALVRGIPKAGAFSINNSAVIVPRAVIEYFLHGTKPEETIYASDDMKDFQIISKVSSKYPRAYQEVNGQMVQTQKCNRVYASENYELGTLYKENATTGTLEKVAGLPVCCVIDNSNQLSMAHVDRDWYVMQAYKTIREFKGTPLKRNTRRVNALKRKILKGL